MLTSNWVQKTNQFFWTQFEFKNYVFELDSSSKNSFLNSIRVQKICFWTRFEFIRGQFAFGKLSSNRGIPREHDLQRHHADGQPCAENPPFFILQDPENWNLFSRLLRIEFTYFRKPSRRCFASYVFLNLVCFSWFYVLLELVNPSLATQAGLFRRGHSEGCSYQGQTGLSTNSLQTGPG